MNATELLKLDLGCGFKPREGYTGVDIANLPGVERVNLLDMPWPWYNDSVSDVWCSHYFEHVPGRMRGEWMDELWRVMVVGGTATIIVPHWNSTGAVQDFTHEWPPVAPQSFMYFNREARRLMGIEHYGLKCHFEYHTKEIFEYIPQTVITMVKLS